MQRIQAELDRLTKGEIRRLALFLPPRHGKSAMTTVRYAGWRLERDPSLRIIIGAYSGDLSELFSRQIRRIIRDRNVTLNDERQRAGEWETEYGGGIKAVGVGSGVTGRGAQLIIIDDPVKSREEANSMAYRNRVWDWYTNDLYTRLEPGGSMILIQTRWHEDDLAGRILASPQADTWTVVNLPAEAEDDDELGRQPGNPLWPARFDKAALADIRETLGVEYYALYQQRPQPASGTIFQRDWFPRPGDIPERGACDVVMQGWDTAFKKDQGADYSACVTMGLHQNHYVVLGVWRGRVEYPGLLRQIRAQAERWRPDTILIEDKGSGTSAVQTLQAETLLPIVPVSATSDKVQRANLITGVCEAGRVYVPQGPEGDMLLDELLRFPSARHDDQVDAFVHVLAKLAQEGQRRTGGIWT